MSLVSVRNFLAPLTNKVHLVSILLLAALFAAYRLSGGGVETGSGRRGADLPSTREVQNVPLRKAPPAMEPSEGQPAAARPRRLTQNPDEPDFLAEMMRPQAPHKDRVPSKEPTDKRSLDDIEKRLGLR